VRVYQSSPVFLLPEPIVDPSAPKWIAAFTSAGFTRGYVGTQLGIAAATLVAFGLGAGLVIAPGAWKVLGILLIVATIWMWVGALRAASRHVVSPTNPSFGRQSIDGPALDLLKDLQSRFLYAKRLVAEIPTGISWADIDDNVRTLLWEAAGQAAQMSALDREIKEMAYAEKGTPQAAYLAELQQRRVEYEHTVLDIRGDAEELAKKAGNAAAAARMALARTGDLRRLEVVVPSTQAIRARDALNDVKARLDMLAGVWGELDPASNPLPQLPPKDEADT
jgi:hypothetical protein